MPKSRHDALAICPTDAIAEALDKKYQDLLGNCSIEELEAELVNRENAKKDAKSSHKAEPGLKEEAEPKKKTH